MKRLIALAVGLLFVFTAGCSGSGGSKAASANSPEGAVQGYYGALRDSKPEVAYSYLKTTKSKDDFVKEKKAGTMTFKDFTVGKATITGKTAVVPVKFKTGVSNMPEITVNKNVEKTGDSWAIVESSSKASGMPGGIPGGTPPAGGSTPQMPPQGSTGGAVPTMPPAK